MARGKWVTGLVAVGAGIGGLFVLKKFRQKKDAGYLEYARAASTGPAPPPEDDLTAAFWEVSQKVSDRIPEGTKKVAFSAFQLAEDVGVEMPDEIYKSENPLGLGSPHQPTLTQNETQLEKYELRRAASGMQSLAAKTKQMEAAGASEVEAAQTAANAINLMAGYNLPVGPDPVVQGQNLLANDRTLTAPNRQSAAAGQAMAREAERIGAAEGVATMHILHNENEQMRAFVAHAAPSAQRPNQATAAANVVVSQIRALEGDIKKMEAQLRSLAPVGQEGYAERLRGTIIREKQQLAFCKKQLTRLRSQGAHA